MQTPRGRKVLHSTCAKLSVSSSTAELEATDNESSRNVYGATNVADRDEATTAYAIGHGSDEGEREKSKVGGATMKISKKFKISREEEIQGLVENGSFDLVSVTEIGKDTYFWITVHRLN